MCAKKCKNYVHHYKQFNSTRKRISFSSSTSAQQNKIFIRLRLGHTSITHQHLFNKEPPPICQFCSTQQLTVHHLFSCPSLQQLCNSIFNNSQPTHFLKYPSIENVVLINNFIKILNLTNCI